MAPEFSFRMHKVSKAYGPQKTILKDISLSFYYGAKIGILGLNGAGKSTLMRIIAGEEKDFTGEVDVTPGLTVGYFSQEPKLRSGATVKEVVLEGMGPVVKALRDFEEISAKLADPDLDPEQMEDLITKQAEAQEVIEAQDGWDIDRAVDLAMEALRLPPSESIVDNLSGGERRRVALCRLLLQKPDVLLLDEPTNHLDAESVWWLERFLNDYEGTVIAVTHDRYFLDNTAQWILELDRGQGIPWKGNYSSWLEQKEKRLALEERREHNRQRTLQRELEWIRTNPKGRQSKSKARINAYEELLNQNVPEKLRDLEIFIPPGKQLGSLVIDGQNLCKSYGDKLLFDNLNFSIPRGAVVGIIGGNGAGKTTLFKMIIGSEKPDAGEIKIGDSVDLSYVDQSRDSLNDDNMVWQEIAGGNNDTISIGGVDVQARAYCSKFNFTGSDQQKQVGVLSGGERNRVHLAKLLKSGGNVLLLDEPTNDLDVNTLRALEDAILEYAGCVLVISHDRWFLDRICTHIIAFEGDSQVVMVEGNFSDYEEDKRKRLGDDALRPKRIKYKKLQ
jgi:ATP-binding cassette ChvD family protein